MKTKILLAMMWLLSAAGLHAATFRNPVINADVPDISVCKVADTYYMVSTTMHLMPGAPVMASKDLKNWKTETHRWRTLLYCTDRAWNF